MTPNGPESTDEDVERLRTTGRDESASIRSDPIGVVRTPLESTHEAPRQGFLDDVEGTVDLYDEYAAGLTGLDSGERVVVVWYADAADRVVELSDGRGVFGTRAPARPNPICLTTVAVLAVDVDEARLRARGVDMRDGTPVLDVKRTLDPERDGRVRPPRE